MEYRTYLRAQILADVQNIRRDPMLKYFILIPPILALLIRLVLPIIYDSFIARDIDITPFYDLIVSYFLTLMVPMLFGVLIGFMLLDERDEQTLLALQVSPLEIERYMMFRIITPMIISLPTLMIAIPLTGVSKLDMTALFLTSVVAALWAPLLGMVLPLVANNKVEGFALMKGLGLVFIIPIVAFFVDPPLQYLFGIIPSYWPVKTFWLASAGEPYLVFLFLSLIFTTLPLWIVVRMLRKKVFD